MLRSSPATSLYTFTADAPGRETAGHTGTGSHTPPAPHGTHDDAPAPLTLPLTQGVHTVAPAVLNVLGGHIAAAGVAIVEPEGQA
jgi:hypothetical protein